MIVLFSLILHFLVPWQPLFRATENDLQCSEHRDVQVGKCTCIPVRLCGWSLCALHHSPTVLPT